MIEEFLSMLDYWWKQAQRNNGKTKKEQLEDMDKDYEDIELEEDPKR